MSWVEGRRARTFTISILAPKPILRLFSILYSLISFLQTYIDILSIQSYYHYIVNRDIVYRNNLKEAHISPQHLPSPSQPLGEPAFYILLSLVNSEKHGYAIMKDVEVLSNGETSLSTSTLYEALSRVLDQGLIERVETGEEQDGHRPRKSYRLSRLGRQILQAETNRMQRLVEQAHLRLVEGEL